MKIFRLLALTLLTLSSACHRSGGGGAGAEAGSGAPAVVAEGSAPASVVAEGSAVPDAGQPGAPAVADAAAALAPAPPPPLPALMQRAGYGDATEASLSEFVHLPPGATGEAGTFGNGSRQARVALITYPNPRYAAPHVSDVQERVRVLPNPREAVASNGPYVLHVLALDRTSAETVRDAVVALLGWPMMD